MGTFVSVRGWIELDTEMVPLVRAAIASSSDVARNYESSWCFAQGGFSEFVFFGCTVRKAAVPAIAELLRTIAVIVVDDGEFHFYPEGIFHLAHEDCEIPTVVWAFRDGAFEQTGGTWA